VLTAAMDELTELEARSDELAAAIRSHIERRRRDAQSSGFNSDAEMEPSKAKTGIYASMARMKAVLDGPVDLLQDLARQVCNLFSSPLHSFPLL
jgi:hypothetical protein